MSLTQVVKARRMDDIINEGLRIFPAGTVSTADVTNYILEPIGPGRTLVIASLCLTCDQASGPLVTLAWRKGTDAPMPFFDASMARGPIVMVFPPGQWIYGDLNYDLVMTTSGLTGNLSYAITGRIIALTCPMNY